MQSDPRSTLSDYEIFNLKKNQSVENAGVAFVKGANERNNFFVTSIFSFQQCFKITCIHGQMLVIDIFSFSHNVSKGLLPQGYLNSLLYFLTCTCTNNFLFSEKKPKMSKKKEDEVIPAMGPGSKISALAAPLRRFMIRQGKQVIINFSTASMKTLPLEIWQNEEIQQNAIELRAESNRLKKLPKQVSDLEVLETLTVQNNALSALPGTISKMKKLTLINAENNSLKSIPGTIHKSPIIKYLHLSNNKIKALPKTINKSTTLELVDVSRNVIRSVKKNIYELKARLVLSHNRLTELPDASVKVPALRVLDVSHNQIQSIPDNINNIVTLTWLDLSYNELEDLPRELGLLKYIHYLNVSHNKIATLPDEVITPILLVISLPQNPDF